jgi:HD-GYP domain-containing protein (c-di-GMP phosphodiesterase class II)
MRGKHFDPTLVDLFFANIEQFLKIYNVHIQKEEIEKIEKMKMNQAKIKKVVNWLFGKE